MPCVWYIDRPRAVIHINVAEFAVAVERLEDASLRGWPVIVAPQGAARAWVFDMSEEAFRAGVHKHMPLARALRLCREAKIAAPRPHRYERAMAALLQRAALGLMQPTAKSLAGAVDLGRDGADGLPLGWVLILVLQEHPYRPLFDLWGVSDSLAHDSILK